MAFSDFDTTEENVIKSKKGITSSLSVPTNGWHIEILQLPFTTSFNEIEMLFTKYGVIDKVAIVYNNKEKEVNCFVKYERESDSLDALKENGKKVGTSSITVIKYCPSGDKGNKRLRTEDSNGWGSTTNNTNTTSNGWGVSDNTSGGWGSSDGNAWDANATNSPSRGGRGGGRGGRGGRGGSSGGGRSCFKCGEEGHMSRECPKGGGVGGGSRSCFKCGEEGHMSRECPKGGGGGSRNCFKCGEEGHMSRECPKGGGNRCFNCQEEGHMSRECTKPRSGRGRGRGGGGANTSNRTNDSNVGEWGSSEATPSSSAATDWD